jgi:hypothetical protein
MRVGGSANIIKVPFSIVQDKHVVSTEGTLKRYIVSILQSVPFRDCHCPMETAQNFVAEVSTRQRTSETS